jgi:hypothetical protein
VRQILFAGEEPDVGPPLLGDVIGGVSHTAKA